MIQEFLIVKQDISFNGSPILKKGAYVKKDVETKIPFLNYNDKSYFATLTRELFEPGTKVRYGNKKYYIIQWENPVRTNCYGDTRLNPIALTPDALDLKLRYVISGSTTDRDKEHMSVYAKDLLPMDMYWFISSKGIVSSAFVGDDQSADQWRVNTGNYFKDKVSAQKELMEISSEFNKHQIK